MTNGSPSGPKQIKHDRLKLQRLLHFAMDDTNVPSVGESLKTVMTAYGDNIHRLRSIVILTIFNIHFGAALERSIALAELEVNGKVDLEVASSARPQKIIDRSAQLFNEATKLEVERSKKDLAAYDKEVKFRAFDAFTRWVMISLSPAPQVTRGLDAMFSSLLLGTWTAFEAMAADAWEQAVNAHPKTLSELKGNWKQRFRRAASTLSAVQASPELAVLESKQVPLGLLQKYQYDLRSAMGSLLRPRFSFDRLDGIREAYGSAFPETPRLDKALSDESLDALSALRNLLVHRAGIVDSEYLRKAKSLKLPQATLGMPVTLDGDVVMNLIGPAINASNELLSSVDEWLIKNQ